MYSRGNTGSKVVKKKKQTNDEAGPNGRRTEA